MTELQNRTDDALIKELRGIQDELKGIKRKGIKQILTIIISAVLALSIGVGVGVYCGIHKDDIMMKLNPKSYAKATITVLEEKLEDEAKLNTGIYKQKSHFDSGTNLKQLFGKDVFFTGKSLSFDYEGSVEAGIKDLSKTKVEVDAKNGTVIVTMPKIEITNVNVDSKSFTNANETSNFFNQIKVDDFKNAYKEMEKKLKKDALESDIIERAQKNAEKTLTVLFGDVVDGYKLEFVWE